MKRLLTIALLCLPTPALADSCAWMGHLAEITMTERQKDIPVEKLRRAAEQNFAKDATAKDIAVQLMQIAYNRELMDTPEGKQAAIDQFRADAEALCARKTSGQ